MLNHVLVYVISTTYVSDFNMVVEFAFFTAQFHLEKILIISISGWKNQQRREAVYNWCFWIQEIIYSCNCIIIFCFLDFFYFILTKLYLEAPGGSSYITQFVFVPGYYKPVGKKNIRHIVDNEVCARSCYFNPSCIAFSYENENCFLYDSLHEGRTSIYIYLWIRNSVQVAYSKCSKIWHLNFKELWKS